MNTTENNKLTAEFMGLDIFYDRMVLHHTAKTGFVTRMKYHESFDWLMPVALRILSPKFCIECADKNIYPWHDAKDEINDIKRALEIGIEPLYDAVIAFLTWYNEQ